MCQYTVIKQQIILNLSLDRSGHCFCLTAASCDHRPTILSRHMSCILQGIHSPKCKVVGTCADNIRRTLCITLRKDLRHIILCGISSGTHHCSIIKGQLS